MSTGTDLPDSEVALLRAIRRAAGPSGTVRTSDLLSALDADGLLGPRAALQSLVDLIMPWRRHLPLVTGEGNWGGQSGDPAADPQYTEVGLSPYGNLALAAAEGSVGPVPLGLIDGSWYRGGQQPPYAPGAVLQALRSRDFATLVPASPTGGTVSGDIDGVAAGRPRLLTLSATVTFEHVERRPPEPFEPPPGAEGGWFVFVGHRDPGGARVVVSEMPYGVTIDDAVQALVRRLHQEDEDRPIRHYAPVEQQRLVQAPAPIVDITDESASSVGVRVVGRLGPDADFGRARSWLLAAPPLTVDRLALLPAPMQTLITEWDAGDGSGLRALTDLIG